MFAVITPALMVGAFAERIKFSGFIIFVIFCLSFLLICAFFILSGYLASYLHLAGITWWSFTIIVGILILGLFGLLSQRLNSGN